MTWWRVFRAPPSFRSTIILAIALLLAQVGALAHAYSHLPNSSKNTPDRAALHSSLCAECSTFGAVLTPGGAANAGPSLPVAQMAGAAVHFSPTPRREHARHHFQAQAPPRTH